MRLPHHRPAWNTRPSRIPSRAQARVSQLSGTETAHPMKPSLLDFQFFENGVQRSAEHVSLRERGITDSVGEQKSRAAVRDEHVILKRTEQGSAAGTSGIGRIISAECQPSWPREVV